MKDGRRENMATSFKGLLWIILGIGIAGNVLHWWNFSIFFRGWWTLFIIIPSIFGVIRNGFRSSSGFWLIVGCVLLFSSRSAISVGWIVKLIIPLALVFAGMRMLMRGRAIQFGGNAYSNNTGNGMKITAVFNGKEEHYPNDLFFGGEATAVFGGADLDLRNAVIENDVTINAEAVFGGVDLKLPIDVNVKVRSSAVFGGVDNHITRAEVPSWPTVYINATAVFGGVDIH